MSGYIGPHELPKNLGSRSVFNATGLQKLFPEGLLNADTESYVLDRHGCSVADGYTKAHGENRSCATSKVSESTKQALVALIRRIRRKRGKNRDRYVSLEIEPDEDAHDDIVGRERPELTAR